MREIKFRAKTSSKVNGFNRKKDGIWVYGFYIDKLGLPVISEFDTTVANYIDYEIDISTLSQYTGLKDVNGVEIYEGDIVNAHYFFENHDPHTLGAFEDEDEITGKIVFDLGGFRILDKDSAERELPLSMIQEPVEELEVLGNIYDNTELLEGL